MNTRIRLFVCLLLVGMVVLAVSACGATPTPLPTATPVPPTATPIPPTATPVPPTDTPVPPTDTPVPPTDTPVPTDTPEPTPAADMDTYRNEVWGIAIDYPAGWDVEESGDQVMLSKQSELTMLLVSALPGEMPLSAETLMQMANSFMGEGITINSEDIESGTIGGYDAAIAPLVADQDGIELAGRLALVAPADVDYTYLFVSITLSALWEQQAPLLEMMINSVEFFTPVAAPPEPTAAPVSGVVEDLELANISNYVDAGGTLHFVGEVVNTGEVAVESVNVSIVLFDDAGAQIAMEEWAIPMNYIPAGQTSPFEVLFLDPPEGASRWEAYVDAIPADFMLDYTYADLVFSEHSSRAPDYGDLEILGVVENVGEFDATFVQVVATVYGAEGNVVAVDYTFVEADVLGAGESSPFTMTFVGMAGDPDRYVLLVQGAYSE